MSVNDGASRTFSRVEGLQLIVERFFDAPRELVFSMHTDPEHISNWWGPLGWSTTIYKMDVKEGGVWHYCMRSSEGQESWGKAVYQEIVEPEKLVYVDAFSDEHGNVTPNLPTMTITVQFAAEENGTRLVEHTLFASEEELRKVMEMGVLEGMTQTLDRLEAYLDEVKET